ncbi:MAG: glycosyltransferase family 2 protein [Pseudomonadota bacterium]
MSPSGGSSAQVGPAQMANRTHRPLISVVMSNYNGAAYLEAAIASLRIQSHTRLEILISDDASTDESPQILQRLASADPRIKPLFSAQNKGAGAARNAALDVAQGDWIAIVDADDLVHPKRLARLLKVAQDTGAHMVADDMVYFGALDRQRPNLLQGHHTVRSGQISLIDLIESDSHQSGTASLGYLKPLIRADRLDGLRYDENLPIGEDFDFYFRLLRAGADFRVIPDPMYLYRRHARSTSHRLSSQALKQMIRAQQHLLSDPDAEQALNTRTQTAMRWRAASLKQLLRYQLLVDALKARRWWSALKTLSRNPALINALSRSLSERRALRRTRKTPDSEGSSQTVLLAAPADIASAAAAEGVVCLPVPPVDETASAPHAHHELAVALARLASEGPLDILAIGPAGLDGLGYAPCWRSAELMIDPALINEKRLPDGVTLKRPPPNT